PILQSCFYGSRRMEGVVFLFSRHIVDVRSLSNHDPSSLCSDHLLSSPIARPSKLLYCCSPFCFPYISRATMTSQTPRRSSSASAEHCSSPSLDDCNLPATWQEGKCSDSSRLSALGDYTLLSECCHIPSLCKNSAASHTFSTSQLQ
ncbi:hypothetical protein BHM03_00049265, partial [Ensete ventricosum]